MQRLLALLKDGHSRTLEMLAAELETSTDDVERQLEYLERIGAIKKVPSLSEVKGSGCAGCAGCNAGDGSPAACKGCIPQNASDNMGNLWEVV